MSWNYLQTDDRDDYLEQFSTERLRSKYGNGKEVRKMAKKKVEVEAVKLRLTVMEKRQAVYMAMSQIEGLRAHDKTLKGTKISMRDIRDITGLSVSDTANALKILKEWNMAGKEEGREGWLFISIKNPELLCWKHGEKMIPKGKGKSFQRVCPKCGASKVEAV